MWSSLLVGWTCALRVRHLLYLGRPQDRSGLTVRRRVPRPQFIEKPQKIQITLQEKKRVKKLLLERMSLRGITRSLEIEIECDELWSYVNSKENPVYIWLAITASKSSNCGILFRQSKQTKCRPNFGISYPKIIKIMGNFIQICGNHIAMCCSAIATILVQTKVVKQQGLRD